MQIHVGQQIPIKGQVFVCTKISTTHSVEFCLEDSIKIRANIQSLSNVKTQDLDIGDFSAGDIINFDYEMVVLTNSSTGSIQVFYTHYKARKEVNVNGTIAPTNQQASSSSDEEPREGDESRESPREPDTGEAGGSLHGYGQSGEGGMVSSSEGSEGREPATSDCGNSNPNRNGD